MEALIEQRINARPRGVAVGVGCLPPVGLGCIERDAHVLKWFKLGAQCDVAGRGFARAQRLARIFEQPSTCRSQRRKVVREPHRGLPSRRPLGRRRHSTQYGSGRETWQQRPRIETRGGIDTLEHGREIHCAH